MGDNCLTLLDPRLCKWMGQQGWRDLNPIQKQAIIPILEHNDDVIISASTASGKTEAAFLPILTYIVKNRVQGISVLYICPLKALINDQTRRLKDMAEPLGVNITPWHGDISANKKHKLLKNPSGIVLITPESLESLLINQVSLFKEAFANLSYIVIDEFHALMGAARGYQLQSQLHRIENLICKIPVRIAISATFSNDIGSVYEYLRANSTKNKCQLITSDQKSTSALAVKILGYNTPINLSVPIEEQLTLVHEQALKEVAVDVFRLLRGRNNLMFTNSRNDTEKLASFLANICQQKNVPNEFFPHHGSLSKDLRESLEHRLQDGHLPTTAICTSTLELGIDISEVYSIAQLSAPASVASLRQRLGRSGRRDGRAVLRLFIPEHDVNSNHLQAILCENTVLSMAVIKLLLNRWYEPPLQQEYAFSTLVQQILSVIASTGGASAKNLYNLLCRTGPFKLTTANQFGQILRSLGEYQLILQMQDGVLSLAPRGEYLVSSYEFFAAFNNDREYRLDFDGRTIGRIPIVISLQENDTFLFAGKSWRVVFFNEQKRIIGVKPAQGKTKELPFGGTSSQIHDALREEMFQIYLTGEFPQCLDQVALENFERAQESFFNYELDKKVLIKGPKGLALFPWKGDRIIETIVLMLKQHSIDAERVCSHIELEFASKANLKAAVASILAQKELEPITLLSKVKNLDWEKFNVYLPLNLKQQSYAQSHLNIPGALLFFERLAEEL